jgi:hypothetical protein
MPVTLGPSVGPAVQKYNSFHSAPSLSQFFISKERFPTVDLQDLPRFQSRVSAVLTAIISLTKGPN